MSGTGGYAAKNGALSAPNNRVHAAGINLGDDLPMICETCLGQNPFVRMVKLPYGDKLCKITGTPYQAFRWKAGPAGRYKETIIGYTVAAERNICQVCLNDMKYGLPVGLRDRLLSDQRGVIGTVALPQSDVGLQYYYQQQAQLVASGELDTTSFATDMQNLPASRQLQQFSQSLKSVEQNQPGRTAFRNLPKLCSFWLNGMCNRVVRKTCPFRPCCGSSAYAFPEIAGSHKELHKKLVEQLTEKGPAVVQKCMDADIKQALSLAIRGTNRDEAIRKRVTGDDDLSNQYMNKMRNMQTSLEPPADLSNVTLWLGGVDDSISEIDIRDQVYAYGWIVSIHISRAGNCAFVEFANREMAENAARYLFKALTIRGKSIAVNWSKGRVGSMTSSGDAGTGHGEETASVMLPPPGMERAPVSDYSILAHTSNSSSSGSGGIIGQATEATNEDAVTGDEENAIGVGEKRPASEQLHKLPRPPVYPSTDPMRLGKS